MRIALAQIDCRVGEVEANLNKIRDYAQQARENNCDMVVFPEMSDTGYDTSILSNYASTWKNGPRSFIRDTAKSIGIAVVCGISEKTENNLYNTSIAFDNEGEEIGKYRKSHLISTEPLCEHTIFTPGDALSTFTYNNITFGLLICYDMRFPEAARTLALNGAQVIVVVSAWPIPRLSHWKIFAQARAVENEVYMACCNRIGTDGPNDLAGASCIVDPWGEAKWASESDEDLLIDEIDLSRIHDMRDFLPVFKQRRSDLYQ